MNCQSLPLISGEILMTQTSLLTAAAIVRPAAGRAQSRAVLQGGLLQLKAEPQRLKLELNRTAQLM